MVARGCGNVPLTTNEVFTAAKSSDIRQVIKHINNKFPHKKIYIVGFSLGAGIVLKYVSDFGSEDSIISGAVAISPFWNWNVKYGLEFCFWNHAILATALKIYYFRNLTKLYIHISAAIALLFAKDCDYFNDVIVQGKELYGYSSRQEYYNDASPLYISHKIPDSIPTLTINADNDPVCSTIGCPAPVACGPGLISVRVHKGGHLAFNETTSANILGYLGVSTTSWADKLATQFITK
jgi:predicted alpha/beta-fold hydrolase